MYMTAHLSVQATGTVLTKGKQGSYLDQCISMQIKGFNKYIQWRQNYDSAK